jgi:hypothetical protein
LLPSYEQQLPDALNEDTLLIMLRQVGAARFGHARVGDTGAGGVKEKTMHELLYLRTVCKTLHCLHARQQQVRPSCSSSSKPKFMLKSADDLRSTAAISHKWPWACCTRYL